MKRMMCAMLVLALLLCGCQSADLPGSESQDQTEKVTEAVTESVTEVTGPEMNIIEPPEVTLPHFSLETESGEPLKLGGTGCARIQYTNNVSSVFYITDVARLPDYEALQGYDAAYFEDKALLVVLESVGSGSAKVGIESVNGGVVTLSHEMPGDAGTADMATWVLWAEVEQGLDYNWTVANPALEPAGSMY